MEFSDHSPFIFFPSFSPRLSLLKQQFSSDNGTNWLITSTNFICISNLASCTTRNLGHFFLWRLCHWKTTITKICWTTPFYHYFYHFLLLLLTFWLISSLCVPSHFVSHYTLCFPFSLCVPFSLYVSH